MSFTDLPSLTNLFSKKSHKCKHSQNSSAFCCCRHDAKSNLDSIKPDRRLRHWEEWMQKRRKMHERLGSLLQRSPGDLLMNSADEFRNVKEEKLALHYTNIPEPDPQRGCPAFWKLPLELKDECGQQTSCFATMPIEEQCRIPEIEHVGLPLRTLKEKDVLPRVRNLQESWGKSEYVQKKNEDLKEKLNQIVPHKPIFSDLFIKGTNLHASNSLTLEEKPETLPKTPPASPRNFPETQNGPPIIFSISINNFHLNPNAKSIGTKQFHVFFEYDVTTKQLATEYLTLKNEGTTVIRFYWKPVEKIEYFKDIIQEANYETYFYFNKNEGLILPGVKIEFPIWFKTEKSGTYCEHWELITKPNVIPVNSRLLIILKAIAVRENLYEKINDIEEDLNSKLRNRLIKETLATVISGVPYEKSDKITVYCYNKKEVFEAVNSEFSLENTLPKYLYDKEVVRELQKFYKKVRRKVDPKTWSYRIDELRLLASAKDRRLENTKYKYKKSKLTADDADELESDKPLSFTEALEKILAKLEYATMKPNAAQNKYRKVYLILCTYISKVVEEFEELRNRLGIVRKSKYPKLPTTYEPLYFQTPRLIWETFTQIEDTKEIALLEPDGIRDESLNVPEASVEESKLPTPPPVELEPTKDKKGGKKDKKGKKEKGKKDNKKDKAGKKGKGKIAIETKEAAEKPLTDSDEEVVQEFNPYGKQWTEEIMVEEEECAVDEESTAETELEPPTQATLRSYNYNTYVIMYTYLCRAVEDIVDVLELEPKNKLPYGVIKELEDKNYNQRVIDLKQLILQENLHRLKIKYMLQNQKHSGWQDVTATEFQGRKTDISQIDSSDSVTSSLWSILQQYKACSKLKKQPISYPMDHYDANCQHNQQEDQPDLSSIFKNISTSTLDGRLDLNWEDFKDVTIQKDYGEEEESDDLVAYIEKLSAKTSVQELKTVTLDKETQKTCDEHVSDEEYFYDSELEFLTDSEQSEKLDYGPLKNIDQLEKSCSCEGLGDCNDVENVHGPV